MVGWLIFPPRSNFSRPLNWIAVETRSWPCRTWTEISHVNCSGLRVRRVTAAFSWHVPGCWKSQCWKFFPLLFLFSLFFFFFCTLLTSYKKHRFDTCQRISRVRPLIQMWIGGCALGSWILDCHMDAYCGWTKSCTKTKRRNRCLLVFRREII